LIALAAVLPARPAAAYETDQYSNRLQPIADSRPVLDQRVNEVLARIAADWRGPADPALFAYKVYRALGGLHWVDRIERFAMKSEAVEKLPQHRWKSIFRGAPFWATRVNCLFGVGSTIRIDRSLLGTDKLGHFMSQGLKYFRSHLAGWSEERITGRGRFNERWIFGQLTTSVYSNADLVANYEGYLFYRSLFEDDVVPGKPAIVRFANGGASIQRPFTWSDHVNDYWDEALNPSFLSPALARFFHRRLPELCGEYGSDPEAFVPANEEELRRRYEGIGIREALEFRIDRICAGESDRVAADRAADSTGG